MGRFPSWFATSPYQPRKRAIVKTLGYRFLMVVVTVTVAYAVVGNSTEALSIGVAANVVKTGTYYAYERFWDRVEWGLD
jgi:uncharacterized membrane protein